MLQIQLINKVFFFKLNTSYDLYIKQLPTQECDKQITAT